MIDGPVARWAHTASPRGAIFDSMADLLFVMVCLYRILPTLAIPSWLWVWIIIIAVIKILSLIICLVKVGRPLMLHTKANKITGFLCFLLPVTIPLGVFTIPALFVAAVATFAAIQEFRNNYLGLK